MKKKLKEKVAEYVVGFLLFAFINFLVFAFQYWFLHIHFEVCALFFGIGVVLDGLIWFFIMWAREKMTRICKNIYSKNQILRFLDRCFSYVYPVDRIRKKVVAAFVADTLVMLIIGLPASSAKLFLAYRIAYLFTILGLDLNGMSFVMFAFIFILFGSRLMFVGIDFITEKLLTLFKGNL